jgi:hypothetical protein
MLAVAVSAQSELDHIKMPRTGLQFPQKLPFEKWLTVGRQLSNVNTSSAWCLGDWLVYGEATYNGRYRDAIERTSLDYKTLRNYAWVARRFMLSRRRDALSFGHHAEVAALSEPEQDFWLRKAENLGWSRNQLRREVRTSLSERCPDAADESTRDAKGDQDRSDLDPLRIQVNVTPDQLKLCEMAAGRAGLSVQEWVQTVIDQAARRMPSGQITLG